MFIRVKTKEEAEKVVAALEELGLKLSEHGAEKSDRIRGIATYIDPFHKEYCYIYLTENMMVNEEPFSWTSHRTEVFSIEELVEKVKNAIVNN